MTSDEAVRERVGGLYDYLGALVHEVHARPVRDIADHDVVLGPTDVPDLPGVRLSPAPGEPWLSVGKLQAAEGNEAGRALYETLFKQLQRLRAEQATHQFVWGHGVLAWKLGKERVCYPLFITPARIDFDDETGELSVAADGLPVLELESLQGLGVPNLGRLTEISDQLAEQPVDVWSASQTGAVYRRVLAPLGLDDELLDGDDLPEPGDAPAIVATWRLFVRRRRVLFLKFFDQLERVAADGDMCAPVVALAAGEDAAREVLAADSETWRPVAERLLLPLEANDEQEQIARKLATHSGVTVQGPPGTGKSHTIANLVSHLVAHGKRVLVTAHKEQALKVVREKIPSELRDLSLAVLGSGASDLTALQRSVNAITNAADQVDEERETVAIARLGEELDRVETEALQLRKVLRGSLETERAEFGARSAPDVAAWLARMEGQLDKIPDMVGPGVDCPLTAAELIELFALARRVSPADAAGAACELPDPRALPSAEDLERTHTEIGWLRSELRGYEGQVKAWSAVDALGSDGLAALAASLGEAVHLVGGIDGAGWPGRLRGQLAQGRQWRDLWAGHADRLAADVARCVALRGERAPERRIRKVRKALAGLWAAEIVPPLGAPVVPPGLVDVETWIDARVSEIRGVLDWECFRWPSLRDRLISVLSGDAVPFSATAPELERLRAVLGGLRARLRLRLILARLDEVAKTLAAGGRAPSASPLWGSLSAALTERDWAGWRSSLESAARFVALRPDALRLDSLAGGLGSVAPMWAQRIREDPASCGDPVRGADLWRWRQADIWLSSLGAEDLSEVQRRLALLRESQRRLTLELTRASAWLATKRALGDAQRQALVGWLQTLRKIGRGTSPRAALWRAEAARLMPRAMSAVPVWIMPYYRVAESFDATVAPPFDVVIVDESSQCDVFALGLLGLGHKIVVVGDDQQISPAAVGVRKDRVDELIQIHLRAFPNAMLLDMESSLYDAATRLFPGVVRLREHFRCLPPIIDFCQRYYGDEILPLREEPADPLPGLPVRAVYVPEGVRSQGSADFGDVNEAEAEAVVEAVAQCCGDPAYAGKTMGVVSLLAQSGQARLIDALLLAKLGPEEYERRRLRCGDAYDFQGDERDVVFISVVADDKPGAPAEARDSVRTGVPWGGKRSQFTSRRYEQRINVAASRSRDQMWVFHSVAPGDLHPSDERAALIRYAQDGYRSPAEAADLSARCESDFERRVLRMVSGRGYRVTPQYRVGNLRIDLVIGSPGRRLAVECDGDKYHGPDQWEDDLRRQAVLERLGWRFWRVRGSAFFRNPDAALASLWPLLTDLDIHPTL